MVILKIRSILLTTEGPATDFGACIHFTVALFANFLEALKGNL